MNDKKLLEFAAKAAGYPRTKWDEHGWFYVCGLEGEWLGPSDFELWNPLTDDGDALRLAVKLKIDVCFDFDRVDAVYEDELYVAEYFYKNPPTDKNAATRRAIVRAAAEIGKETK
jgi:hypothetical protein